MVPADRIAAVLADLDDGAEVRLRMNDGSEWDAIVVNGELTLENSDEEVDLDRVEEVLVDAQLGGRDDAPE
jgi:hypothetical protein